MAYGNTPSCGGATLSSVKFTSGCWVIYKTTSICALFIVGTGGDQPHQAAAAREEREGPVIDAPLCAWHRGWRWSPRAAELGRVFTPVSAVTLFKGLSPNRLLDAHSGAVTAPFSRVFNAAASFRAGGRWIWGSSSGWDFPRASLSARSPRVCFPGQFAFALHRGNGVP